MREFKIVLNAAYCYAIVLYKNSLLRTTAERLDANPATSTENIQKTDVIQIIL